MNFIGKTLRTGAAATLLLAGTATATPGNAGDSSSSFGPPGTKVVRIRDAVVRTGGTLEEVGNVHSDALDFYQPRYTWSRVVLGVLWTSNTARWQRVVWPPQLWGCSEEQLLQMLSNMRTLDITRITLSG